MAMSDDHQHDAPIHSPAMVRLAAEGRVKLATKSVAQMLEELPPRRGPVTDAGTRALQAERGE